MNFISELSYFFEQEFYELQEYYFIGSIREIRDGKIYG